MRRFGVSLGAALGLHLQICAGLWTQQIRAVQCVFCGGGLELMLVWLHFLSAHRECAVMSVLAFCVCPLSMFLCLTLWACLCVLTRHILCAYVCLYVSTCSIQALSMWAWLFVCKSVWVIYKTWLFLKVTLIGIITFMFSKEVCLNTDR